ncbi:MAG: leucine-rich repeat domain-containing protein, partial [Clostridia bacterium]|nr:leucine-rich repeat domain-containing protein [Clostridia bacterium]
NAAFSGCTSLTNIEIPSSVTYLGSNAFKDCGKLKSIEIPTSVTSIGSSVFSGCISLESMTLPFVGDGKAYVAGAQLFGYIFGSSEYTGGVSVNQYINKTKYHTFCIPSSLKSVRITGGNVDEGAFSGCSSLESIEIPTSTIRKYVFMGCSKLTNIKMPSNVTFIGEYAFAGTAIKNIELASDFIGGVSDYAFSGCSKLESVEMPSGVNSIGECAFANCSRLMSVVIPSSVKNIGGNAFYSCSSLTIYCVVQGKLGGWSSSWNSSNRPVVWSYKG